MELYIYDIGSIFLTVPLGPTWDVCIAMGKDSTRKAAAHGLSAASRDGLSLSWPGGCDPCACKPRPRGHERQRRTRRVQEEEA